ncbi:MAG: protein kinase [Deltaproteobacteria bacterium]|nr:protein kinase [Deltaproteobacteria bacterium]
MTSCPPADKLLEFAAGALPDDQAATLEKHIDECTECRGALSNLARGDAPPSFGRYRIDTVLGSGGMGIVYRAWDPQLARPVAIKVVRRGGEDTQGRARLVREAQALARLSHPNVCHVYDVGTDADEVWVAMELIDGVSLRQWVDQTRTREQIMDVLLGAANGIAAAHEAGLVHRDVKPENVLITRDGRAIVTDFGLARTEDRIDPNASTLSTDPHLTATGAIAGTPAYIAPEQLTGDPIDARVDQFAWAVMAWELLVGARPFPIIFAARIEAVQNGLKPPESLPKHIGAALVKAMSYVARDRYPSMRELIEAMRAAPAVPVTTAKIRRRERSDGEARSRAPAIAGLVVLGMSGIAIGAWVFARGPEHAAAKLPEPSPSVATVESPKPAPPLPAVTTPSPAVTSPSPPVAPPDAAPAPAKIVEAPKKQQPAVAVAPKKQPAQPAPPPPGQQDLAPSNASTVAAIKAAQSARAVSVSANYCRSCMVASMDSFCRIPIDPSKPAKFETADWGKVVKVEQEVGEFRDQQILETVITLKGQRDTYRLDADFLDEHVDTNVGDWLAFCVEDQNNNIYQLSGGPTWRTHAVITISGPPRVGELAKLDPIHIPEIKMVAEGLQGKFSSIDPAKRYLIRGQVKKASGGRWEMDRYEMQVPAGIPGAKLMATGKRLWFVVDHLRFEDDPAGGKQHLVVDAAYILDDLFP